MKPWREIIVRTLFWTVWCVLKSWEAVKSCWWEAGWRQVLHPDVRIQDSKIVFDFPLFCWVFLLFPLEKWWGYNWSTTRFELLWVPLVRSKGQSMNWSLISGSLTMPANVRHRMMEIQLKLNLCICTAFRELQTCCSESKQPFEKFGLGAGQLH